MHLVSTGKQGQSSNSADRLNVLLMYECVHCTDDDKYPRCDEVLSASWAQIVRNTGEYASQFTDL